MTITGWVIEESTLVAISGYIVSVAFVLALYYIFSRKVQTAEHRAFWFLSVSVLFAVAGYPEYGWWMMALWLVFIFIVNLTPALRSLIQ